MPSLLDWNALIHKAQAYIGEYDDCATEQSAFTHIVLEYALSLDPEEIENSITDGPNDRGVDAVYVDSRDDRNTIHLFQFKHVGSFDKANHNFPSSEIDKLLSFCSDVLEQSPNLKKTCNALLWAKVEEIWDALKRPEPLFAIHLAGNMLPLVSTERKRLEGAIARYRSFRIHEYSLESVVGMFLERKQPRIDASLTLVDMNYFERTDGNIRGLIGTVEAEHIVQLISDSDNPDAVRASVFNDNVRVYLTRKNQINRKIIASAVSNTNAEFWYLNNGITMTCDSFSYQAGQRAPKVALKNVQIVNGGQTSHALFEAQKEAADCIKRVLVLVRIYETKTKEISAKIAESTNSQTPINTRDLRSNDDVQKTLEESFRDMGLYYERKAKQHADQARGVRIDALVAGQACLAYHLAKPEVAKKDRARVFSDLYGEVFNEDVTPVKMLVPLRVLSEIEKAKRELQRRIRREEKIDTKQLFLVDGAYHVLYAVSAICVARNLDPLDEGAAKKLIKEAQDIVSDLVQKETSADEAFSFNRFFKDARTRAKIDAAIAAVGPQRKPQRSGRIRSTRVARTRRARKR